MEQSDAGQEYQRVLYAPNDTVEDIVRLACESWAGDRLSIQHWLITMTQFGSAVWNLASLVPAGKRRQAEKLVADSFPRLELPWVGEEHELSWLNLAENMERALRQELILLWQDLRAIDSVVGGVSQEFDGEDPLRPVMRGIVEKTRLSLTQLHEFLSLREPFALPAPDDEALALAQTYFENGRRLMQSL